jgi:hypothetical protein
MALLGHVRPNLLRRECTGIIAAFRGSLSAASLRLGRFGHAVMHRLHLAIAVKVKRGVIGLGWLAVDVRRLLWQLRLTPTVDFDDSTALRQVARHPFMLGAEEALDIRRGRAGAKRSSTHSMP